MAINKTTLKKVADSERTRQLGKNDNNPQKLYDNNEAMKNIGGNAIDKAERTRQTGFNEYNSSNQYNLNKID